ncbi:MAG: putative double-strand break repair protein AddB-like [Rhodospirillales bacterium]|nr:putative double-strand break repair protein AddB-like [Rhodospirillales bacterium]
MGAETSVFNLPAGFSFVDALAERLIEESGGDPLALARMQVLLPTRRAVRSLTEAFLRASDGRPLLLPRMRPLGDLDAEELVMSAPEEAADAFEGAVPPAIPAMRRQVLLARAVLKGPNAPARFDQALALGRELGRFLDQVQTDGLSLAALEDLVPADYAAHWQETLEFLKILGEVWPKIRAIEGGLDPAERRLKLIAAQAARWRAEPPNHPVIAAGSTGSLAPVAELLSVVARLPQGRVVLPGLDRSSDPGVWAAVEADPGHPQHGLARLLKRLELTPGAVPDWPLRSGRGAGRERHALVLAALRPAPVADLAGYKGPTPLELALALSGLRRLDCKTPEIEARAIALLMREALEEPGKTAALITPDRGLARRVAAELKRWGVAVDDSAGVPLLQTPPGLFLRLVAEAVVEGFAPVPLLALLKHPLAALGLERGRCRSLVRAFERRVLRGPRPAPGLGCLAAAAKGVDNNPGPAELMAALEPLLSPLEAAFRDSKASFGELLKLHVETAERLAATDRARGPDRLWAEEAGEALASAMHDIAEAARDLDEVAPAEYPAMLEALLQGIAVRPRYGRHPRLFIWGPLEARLQRTDLAILGGLNEGTWPAEPEPDPWMSRPMRAKFGLPPLERRIGLAAHDFVQGAMAPEVVLTRSVRVEGTPTVPARWLLRLDALLAAIGHPGGLARPSGIAGWGADLDKPARFTPVPPPQPRPPVDMRPRKLSVTQIGAWMADPYAIYARHVLRLKKLDPIDAEIGPADRGNLVHRILDRFVALHPDALPQDAEARLLALADEIFKEASAGRPAVWAYWRPRLERIARWFLEQERERRQEARPLRTEVAGAMTIPAAYKDFVLTAKADRIDRLADGRLAIIDYKTGGVPFKKDVAQGIQPQLPLEAAIAQAGGFEGVAAAEVGELAYWRITGAREPGKVCEIAAGADAARLAAEAVEGLTQLIATFDDPATPFEPMPWPERIPRFSDYRHLARIAEWSDLDET